MATKKKDLVKTEEQSISTNEVLSLIKSQSELINSLKNELEEKKRVVNTKDSIFKDSQKSDEELSKNSLENAKNIIAGERVPFVCREELIGLFPDGLSTTVQGISIILIFDGRTVDMPKALVPFIEKKIKQKAEIEKKKRSHTKETASKNFIGSY